MDNFEAYSPPRAVVTNVQPEQAKIPLLFKILLITYLVLAFGPVLPAPAVRGLLALPVVVTVVMSMASLYLDYHWLTDLVAGAALGLALLALVLAWDVRRQHAEHGPRDDEPAITGAAGKVLAPTRPPV